MILYVSMFHISHINSCIFDIYRWFENVILALHTNVKRTWNREPRVLRRAGRPISCDTTPRDDDDDDDDDDDPHDAAMPTTWGRTTRATTPNTYCDCSGTKPPGELFIFNLRTKVPLIFYYLSYSGFQALWTPPRGKFSDLSARLRKFPDNLSFLG